MGWHIVGFGMTWFVLSDTFYRSYSKWVSFFASFLFYPILAIVSQIMVS